jgi:hypothetical protein
MNKLNNRKIIVIVLAVLLLIVSAAITTDIPDKVISLCKGFIYCNPAGHR